MMLRWPYEEANGRTLLGRAKPLTQERVFVALDRGAQGAEPISVDTAKGFAKIDEADDDAVVATLLSAARRRLEDACGRSFSQHTWTLTLDTFPDLDYIRLPMGPLASITTFTTYDTANDADTTFTGYFLSDDRLVLDDGEVWPTDLRDRGAVAITYVAGYSSLPADLEIATLQLFAHSYENRNVVSEGVSVQTIPFGVAALIAPYARYRL